jgi:hypothetical protein
MTVEARPTWDPTGTLRVSVDSELRELVVSVDGERIEFALRTERPERLGWVRRTPPRRRVAVGEVVAHCLRDWYAEQEVLAITEQAAREAARRGGSWWRAAGRLRDQNQAARRSQRLAVLPFQLLWRELAQRKGESLTASTAARRAGFLSGGRGDTSRFERRLGLRPTGGGSANRNTTVNYETGLTLCRALDRDPVELGL